MEFQEIADRILRAQENISAACVRCGRKDTVRLIGATKTQSPELITFLNDRKILTDVGENRVQELTQKYPYGPDLHWHMIGQLQSNKVKYIIDRVDLIHSLDRISLAQEIQKQAFKHGIYADCLIEINMGSELSKGGIEADELLQFVPQVLQFDRIRIRGLMAVMPNTTDIPQLIGLYRKLRRMYEILPSLVPDSTKVDTLSCGMSNDYEIAICEGGSTAVRLGRELFGARN